MAYNPEMLLYRVGLLLFLLVVTGGQLIGATLYADKTNPLVKLGMQRVWAGVEYPSWMLYPGLSGQLRQSLVDLYSIREALESMDKSSEPVQRHLDAVQLIMDLLSAAGGEKGSIRATPTKREINEAVRAKLVPTLTKPREGSELDAPSDNEAAYRGPSGDIIRDIDLKIKASIRVNHIPTGYVPPADRNFDAWYRQQCSAALINNAKAVWQDLNCDKHDKSCDSDCLNWRTKCIAALRDVTAREAANAQRDCAAETYQSLCVSTKASVAESLKSSRKSVEVICSYGGLDITVHN